MQRCALALAIIGACHNPPDMAIAEAMRVATYTQPNIATRGSLLALCTLVLVILLGTSTIHTLVLYFVPQHSALDAGAWLLTYLIAFLGLMFGQGINWISWLIRYRILLVVLLLGAIGSVFWSVDTTVSAIRTVHLMGASIVAIYLGFSVPMLTTLRVFAVVLAVIIMGSIAVSLGLPELGLEQYEGKSVWRGLLNSKNALGFWAAIGVLLYATLSDSLHSRFLKLLCYLMVLVSAALLMMSQSATSMLALLVAGGLSLYLFIANRFELGFIRMTVLAALFIGVVGLAIGSIDTAELLGRSGDLTGRSEVWRQTWKLIMERPLTGYGYGAIWFPNDATLYIQQALTDFSWVVYHAHNGFLQVASEIGLPLSCVALLMVAQQLIEIFYCQYERQQVGVLFVLAFVIAYLLSNFSEARFLVNRELYWIFFLALPISMLRQINLVSGDPADWETSETERDVPFDESAAAVGIDEFDLSHADIDLGHDRPVDAQSDAESDAGSDDRIDVVETKADDALADDDTFDPGAYGLSPADSEDEADTANGRNPEGIELQDSDASLDDTLDLTRDAQAPASSDDTFDPADYGVDKFGSAIPPDTAIGLGNRDTADVDAIFDEFDLDSEGDTAAYQEQFDRFDLSFTETGEWIDIPLGGDLELLDDGADPENQEKS